MINFQTIKEKVLGYDKKTYIIAAVLLIAGIIAYDMFSSGLHDNGSGADQIRSDIRSAKQQQSDAIGKLGNVESGLNDSAESAGRISDEVGSVSEGINDTQNTITDAQDRINTSQGIATDSASLIAEGKRIIAAVRERGKIGN